MDPEVQTQVPSGGKNQRWFLSACIEFFVPIAPNRIGDNIRDMLYQGDKQNAGTTLYLLTH